MVREADDSRKHEAKAARLSCGVLEFADGKEGPMTLIADKKADLAGPMPVQNK